MHCTCITNKMKHGPCRQYMYGPSNKVCPRLQPKSMYITNKTERFSFKDGCTRVVPVLKHSKQDWSIILQ